MFRKNLDKIVGTFTKTLEELDLLVAQRQDEISITTQVINTAQDNITEANADIAQATKIRNNISKLIT